MCCFSKPTTPKSPTQQPTKVYHTKTQEEPPLEDWKLMKNNQIHQEESNTESDHEQRPCCLSTPLTVPEDTLVEQDFNQAGVVCYRKGIYKAAHQLCSQKTIQKDKSQVNGLSGQQISGGTSTSVSTQHPPELPFLPHGLRIKQEPRDNHV